MLGFSIPLRVVEFDVLHRLLSEYVKRGNGLDKDVEVIVVPTLVKGFEKKAVLHLSK